MKLKNFKKFVALILTFVLMLATFSGCGDAEKKDNAEDNEVTTGANNDANDNDDSDSSKSFAELMLKAYTTDKYSYKIDMDIEISSDEIKEAISEDEVKQMFEAFGISGDTIKGKLSFAGKANGMEAASVAVSVEIGKVSGEITEVIFVDNKAYLSVKKTVDFVGNIAKEMGLEEEFNQIKQMLPAGDYIEIPLDDIMDDADFAEVITMFNSVDKEAVNDFAKCLFEEIEKIAKKANVLSTSNGYTISISKDNMFEIIKSGMEVVVNDIDTIYEKAKKVAGDEMEVLSKEDIEEAKAEFDKITDEDWNDLKGIIDEVMSDLSKLDVSFGVKENGKAVIYSANYDIGAEDAAIKLALTCEMQEDANVKIEAPTSLMPMEELEELIASMSGQNDMNMKDFVDLDE